MALDLQELFERVKSRELVPEHESIVIALHHPSWDYKLNRGTTSTFRKPNKSASRLAVYNLDQIIQIFRTQIGAGRIKIDGYGIITVSEIYEVGQAGETKIDFAVTVDPVPGNDAHAEIIAYNPGKASIRKNIPDGICNRLLEAMKHHALSE